MPEGRLSENFLCYFQLVFLNFRNFFASDTFYTSCKINVLYKARTLWSTLRDYVVGSKVSSLTYKSRAKWKML